MLLRAVAVAVRPSLIFNKGIAIRKQKEAINTNRPTQTMIIYKAYLTHVQLKEFLASLMEKGLIEYHKLVS
jgi:predicted transcriptional regulator